MLSLGTLVALVPLLSTLVLGADENLHQNSKRACSSRVNINTKKLPWLDYPAMQQAADDAVAEIERARLSDDPDIAKRAPEKRALTCPTIRERKEWRKLTRDEQKAYLAADKCLQKAPSHGVTNSASHTMYDAFPWTHQQDWTRFHGNAMFLPWHRWIVWMHGEALTKVCNYTGAIPYWDFVQDSANVFASPIFSKDPEIGFGDGGSVATNEIGGKASGYKVDNGAFANYRPNIPVSHFLLRNFTADPRYNPGSRYGIGLGNTYTQAQVNKVLAAPNFWQATSIIDGLDGQPQGTGIHNGPHFMNTGDGIGPGFLEGTPYFFVQVTAPNDPLFFVQHANVDYVWWQWQQKSKTNQFDYRSGDNRSNRCDKLPFATLGPDMPVAAALKTEWYPLCYTNDVSFFASPYVGHSTAPTVAIPANPTEGLSYSVYSDSEPIWLS